MDISSIDDLLVNQNNQPAAPEEMPSESPEVDGVIEVQDEPSSYNQENDSLDDNQEGDEEKSEPEEIDDYGNPKAKPKLFTEDEVNERINRAVRDRLARVERNNDQQQQVQQKAQSEFEYDPESTESWQQQLETFVEKTVYNMQQKETERQAREREAQIQIEFEQKFHQGMSRFGDFQQVVANQPFSDAMVLATRGMADPAAFIYAASKRAPQEIQRIAQIQDPYTQMREIGALEARLKQSKPATGAPKPIGRVMGDGNFVHKSDKEPTIEEQIAQAEARKWAKVRAARR